MKKSVDMGYLIIILVLILLLAYPKGTAANDSSTPATDEPTASESVVENDDNAETYSDVLLLLDATEGVVGIIRIFAIIASGVLAVVLGYMVVDCIKDRKTGDEDSPHI